MVNMYVLYVAVYLTYIHITLQGYPNMSHPRVMIISSAIPAYEVSQFCMQLLSAYMHSYMVL